MHVVFVQASVLSNLRAAREDHAGVHLEDDVRSARIVARSASGNIELVREGLEREDFLNAERFLISGCAESFYDARRQRRIGEPD